jgi:hypothetical protein
VATTKKTTKKKPIPKTATVWVKSEDAKLPDRGADGWYSLRLLLDFYSPGVLATAIEKHGIYTNDRHGRTIHCTANENTEQYQQALDVLADWQSELDDPGPEYSWDSERYEVETHPTDHWYWPATIIEDLKAVEETSKSDLTQVAIAKHLKMHGWKKVIQDEAERRILEIESKGAKPNFTALSVILAKWATANGVTTDGKHYPAAEYINIHVISAEVWTAPLRQKYRKRKLGG